MIQQIVLHCPISKHAQQPIVSICTNEKCLVQQHACCTLCISEFHNDHIDSIIKINEEQHLKLFDLTPILTQLQQMISQLQIQYQKYKEVDFVNIFQQNPSLQNLELLSKQIRQGSQLERLNSKFKLAATYLSELLRKDDEDFISNNQIREIEILQHFGRFEKSLSLLDEILIKLPNCKDALKLKGRAFCGLFKYQEALECANRTIEIDSHYMEGYYLKSSALSGCGNFEEALEVLEKAIELDPTNPKLLSLKAGELIGIKQVKESKQWIDKAANIDPDNRWVLFVKANAYIQEEFQDYEASSECLNKIFLQTDHLYKQSLIMKSQVLGKLKKIQEQQLFADMGIIIGPFYKQPYYLKINSLLVLKENEKANEMIEQMLVEDPKDENALLFKFDQLMIHDKIEEGINLIEKVLEYHPDSLNAQQLKNKALAYQKMKKQQSQK